MSFGIKFEDSSSKEDNKLVWSSEKVSDVLKSLENGVEIKHSPFFDGDVNYKKGNLVFNYSDFEYDELKKCAKDIIYFANKYCQVMTDDGYMKINLREYQVRMLRNFQKNRWNIVLAPRQVGKTICSAIYLTWFLLFHFDKNIMLLSNKGKTTREIMDKIRAIMEGLPFFLKPGVLRKDVMSMKFDNGCRIIGENTTATAGIGFTIHLLFLDEFAHVQDSIADEFWGNVYPTLSSSAKSQLIITSTPNGYNLYQKLWQGAIDGDSELTPFKVDWWEVPGRDEEWKSREIAILGSEEEFNKQYGCQFIQGNSLLLSSVELKMLKANTKEFIFQELDALDDLGIDYSFLTWHPDFDVDVDIDDHSKYFAFSIDLAEGVGEDYSIINIFSIKPIEPDQYKHITDPGSIYDFFSIDQIAIFRCNVMSITDVSKILYALCVEVFNPEQLKLIIEYNTYGELLMKNLTTLYPSKNDFDEETIVKYKHRNDAKNSKPGLKVNADNKKILCQSLKDYIKNRKVSFSHKACVEEVQTFSRNSNGTYSAQSGNDDAIMTIVNACSFFDTSDYKEFVEEYFDLIDDEIKDSITKALSDNDIDTNLDYNIYDIV